MDWEKMIEAGIARIPKEYRERFKNIAILLEDEPSVETRREEGLADNETLLGLYHGIPLSERGEGYGIGETLPDTITLYTLPILEAGSSDPKRVAEIVADTIWHEFGHYFGLEEDEVRRREEERGMIT